VTTPSPTPTTLIDPDRATPGLWGLFFFVALAVAVYFLYRSMSRQLSRVTFDEDAPAAGAAHDPSAGGPADPDA
jgi:hypothetical protein